MTKKITLVLITFMFATISSRAQTTNIDSLQMKLDALQKQLDILEQKLEEQTSNQQIQIITKQTKDGDQVTIQTDTNIIQLGNLKFDLNEKDLDLKDVVKADDCDFEDREFHRFETKWGGLDLGVNSFLTNNKLVTPQGFKDLELIDVPVVVNIHVLRSQLNLFAGHLNINYGVYFELNNYKFRSNNFMISKIDSISFDESQIDLKKNKLFASYVHLPVMLEFIANPNKPETSFRFAIGGSAGYLVGAHTKRVLNNDDKIKEKDDFNLNKIRYGITARIGVGNVNFFATYSLSNMFRDGVEPVVTPVSVGLSLIGFDN